ncbi:MAG: YaaR family protein [Lachnospiraceae bacterium]|nr:YaaR family protein [Lachnospiraceae bacterium]MCR5023014.1 YaaR family protein [Lachnospiraceae bacterium]
MDIKVNQAQQVAQTEAAKPAEQSSEAFRFALMSNIEEADLQERLTNMMNEITMQGSRIKKKKDIGDMRKYRSLIKDFMNEIVNRSHKFSRENFLDRRGRHRVYGIIKLIDENLDSLAEELLKDESDNLTILNKIGEIEGLLIDILT